MSKIWTIWNLYDNNVSEFQNSPDFSHFLFLFCINLILIFFLQKLFVITAFNENLIDSAISHIHKIPWIGAKLEAPFKELLVKQKEKLHRKVGTAATTVSL